MVIRLPIVLLVLGAAAGCGAPTAPSVSFRELHPSGLLNQAFACESRLRIVNDAAEFNSLTAGIEFAEPAAVDFSHETAVMLSLGSRPSAGFSLDVRAVHKQGSELLIEALETPPGACATLPVVTCPWLMVVVPKTSAADAAWTTVVRPCAG